MAFNLEVKYYNSFWLKQVTSPNIEDINNANDSFVNIPISIPYIFAPNMNDTFVNTKCLILSFWT